MRFLGRSIAGLFLLAVTLGLLGYAGIVVRDAVQARMADDPRAWMAQERVFAVEVLRVEPGTEVPVLSAYGRTEAQRSLELRAEAAGRVEWSLPGFTEGGRVSAGQMLLRIVPTDGEVTLEQADIDRREAEAERRAAEAALALSHAELTAARNEIALRTRTLDRQRDLVARSVGAAASVEDAELALASAEQTVLAREQAVAAAEARLDRARIAFDRTTLAHQEARRRFEDTVVIAEFDGELADVVTVDGRLLAQGERLATLVSTTALEVAFRVSAAHYARLIDTEGVLQPRPVRVVLEVADLSLVAEGTLTRAAAEVGEGESGRLVFAELAAAPGFKPGDFVTVEVEEPALADVARLPARAVNADGFVLVLDTEDRLQEAAVTVLRRQGDDVIVAADAIAGRDVVAVRTPLLGAGIKVRPLRRDAQRAELVRDDEMVALSDDRRAALRAMVEGTGGIPEAAKTRILAQLDQPLVPARVVAGLESRFGG
jgi:hypothetical protein